MARGGRDLPASQVETPEGLRTMARRAHRLAMDIPDDESAKRLLAFASELEARAEALETIEAEPPAD